jgi:serine phosphatase RsbU (regulator of sigma subunit)
VQVEALEPGDTVLLYTDGVTDARTSAGSELGLERLVDLLEREAAAETPPEETLRRVIRRPLGFQGGELRDAATRVRLQCAGPAVPREPVELPQQSGSV